jgi:hypothetical protein
MIETPTMQLSLVPESVFKVRPPPLWYVTNGEIKVGPVLTGLLIRGVEAGRVPDFCQVSPQGGDWRALSGVREISALYTKPNAKLALDLGPDWLGTAAQIRDDEQLSHTVSQAALSMTGAECAMFHFRRRQGQPLVTRAVLGPIATDRLGRALPMTDLVLRAAVQGRPVFGPPYGPTEDALAIRFAASAGGVGAAAMVPFFTNGTLVAMLELARPGHAFRRSDLQKAERHVQRALRMRHKMLA